MQVDKEPNMFLSIAVVLDLRYKLNYLDFCYKKIHEPEKASMVMTWVEIELRRLFKEYKLKYESCCLKRSSTSN